MDGYIHIWIDVCMVDVWVFGCLGAYHYNEVWMVDGRLTYEYISIYILLMN